MANHHHHRRSRSRIFSFPLCCASDPHSSHDFDPPTSPPRTTTTGASVSRQEERGGARGEDSSANLIHQAGLASGFANPYNSSDSSSSTSSSSVSNSLSSGIGSGSENQSVSRENKSKSKRSPTHPEKPDDSAEEKLVGSAIFDTLSPSFPVLPIKKEMVNLAAWLCGVNDLRIMPYELPQKLGPHDVRIQMKAVGICGSDVHYLKKLQCAGFVVKEPMVIGHESAGVVVEVGSGVKRCKVGDRVALEPGISCGRCELCKTGRYNLCPEMAFFATPPVHGSLAQQVVHPEDLCFVLPENVSLEEGAMCEPLSVGVHACRRAGSLVGAHVAVMGAGPIGLVTMMVARAFGASRVVIADVDKKRLQFAKQIGADEIIAVSSDPSAEEKEVKELRDSLHQRIDITFDCVGMTKSMRTSVRATDSGGKVMLVGMGHAEMTLPLTATAAREVDVIGVFRYCNTYPLCIELLKSKKIDVKPLITHRFKFSQEEVLKAFAVSAAGGDAIKVMFNL